MAKEILKDPVLRGIKPGEKDQRLNDGSGLYLLVKPSGSKWWRLDYTFEGKRKTLSLGTYPDTTLANARRKAQDARSEVADGIDPSTIRKEEKISRQQARDNEQLIKAGLAVTGSFKQITGDWLATVASKVSMNTHTDRVTRFERLVYPHIGNIMLTDVKAPAIYNLLKPLIAKGTLDTAQRVRGDISSVFTYAIVHGLADFDPAQAVTAMLPAKQVKPRAALTKPADIAGLLRAMASYQGSFVVTCALNLSPLLFQRPGEIRQMQWADVDLDACEWRPFVSKTKVHHIVPLSRQAVKILESVKAVTGIERYVFPSIRGGNNPMSVNTLGAALKVLGYDGEAITPHGFRAIASTILNEQGWHADAIERQLCHMPKDAVRAAYHRSQYLDERRKMMQAWADYLDGLKNGAQVVPIRKQG